MKEKIKKYIDLIPKDEIKKWSELSKEKKELLKNVLSCLEEKGVELDKYEQMEEIYTGINCGLSSLQIILYIEPNIDVFNWKFIRWTLINGVPIEVIKPIINENFTPDKLDEIKEKYFNEKHEKDKKAFIDSLF